MSMQILTKNDRKRSDWLFETPWPQMELEDFSEDIRLEKFDPPIALDTASKTPVKRGLYAILRDGKLIYVGQTANLSGRLRYHRLSLTHFNIPTKGYTVRILPLPNSTPKSRKEREQKMLNHYRKELQHQRATAEAEYYW